VKHTQEITHLIGFSNDEWRIFDNLVDELYRERAKINICNECSEFIATLRRMINGMA